MDRASAPDIHQHSDPTPVASTSSMKRDTDTVFAVASRPPLPSRQTSYSKRHASFDTPREVPLPSPILQLPNPFQNLNTTTAALLSHSHASRGASKGQGRSRAPSMTTFEAEHSEGGAIEDDDESSDDSFPSAPASPLPRRAEHAHDSAGHHRMDGVERTYSRETSPETTFRDRREARLRHLRDPSGHRFGSSGPTMTSQGHLHQHGTHMRPQPEASTSALPLPSSTASSSSPNSSSLTSGTASTSVPLFPFSRPLSVPQVSVQQATVHDPTPQQAPWRTSSASLPLPMQTPYFSLPQMPGDDELMEWRAATASSSSSLSTSGSSAPAGAASSAESSQPRGEVGAARPPPAPSEHGTGAPQRRPGFGPEPARSDAAGSSDAPTGVPPATSSPIGRSILRSLSPTLRPPLSYSLSLPLDHRPPPSTPSVPSVRSLSATTYPPPAPPTILTPPPLAERHPSAPHEPFLSHAPPPEDCWIAVETSAQEYKLIVRLPSFRRDGITLATRRRRILHLVADSWEASGGHFERRISFGYDADLAQVRAEFDGELLRVVVPRRVPQSAWLLRQQDRL